MCKRVYSCDSTKSVRTKAQIKSPEFKSPIADIIKKASPEKVAKALQLNIGVHTVPRGIADFDKENWNDVYQVSHYAMDIFNYMKNREVNNSFVY